jgi:hypothetical protein
VSGRKVGKWAAKNGAPEGHFRLSSCRLLVLRSILIDKREL